MYTQCPDCEVAFKVTAAVLKQAAGTVRCGACGNAFNALAYLSEQELEQPAAEDADAALPELKPETMPADEGLPRSISAEQSAALLKTLDELAGSDIRIEDTGVEWRVLDEQEEGEAATDGNDAEPDADARSSKIDELRFDDNTPLPDGFGLDDESPYVAEPSSEVEDNEDDPVSEEAAQEFSLSEPDEWNDLLGEFQELAAEVAPPADAVTETADDDVDEEILDEEAVGESSVNQPLDMDTQFALQAEAMGIDLSGIHEKDEALGDEAGDALEDIAQEEDLEDEELEEVPEEAVEEEEPEEEQLELDEKIANLDPVDEPDELIEEPIIASHTIEDELAGLSNGSDDHHVPPMTEEEHTVNMQIDQDLMALAIEDDDGFASTIIIPEEDAGKKEQNKKDGAEADDTDNDFKTKSDALGGEFGFETIIMEGETVRSALDSGKLAEDAAAAAKLAKDARENDFEQAQPVGDRRYGMIAAAVLLVLLLAIQIVHQSREALATIPAFSNTIGQVYRAIGQPVQPAWNITGWRFEATKGSTQGEDEVLTVYSRLGNNSDGPLPYPLIGISLTDRFEETIGSRMLDPAEYLPTDLDPRKLVAPGNTFNAVITITSTSEDATGFKLNVCYRLSAGQLRCAIDDFK